MDFLKPRRQAERERQTERMKERQREDTRLTQRRGQPQTRRTLRSGEAQPREQELVETMTAADTKDEASAQEGQDMHLEELKVIWT